MAAVLLLRTDVEVIQPSQPEAVASVPEAAPSVTPEDALLEWTDESGPDRAASLPDEYLAIESLFLSS